ncbi:hypothetical protein MES4922_550017 [Mesorhizobium ventifaucium]|uniref:Uncharacterized protein n=1 Tax=Mesorhizobium ventifaucium TaxID=666020 RepID=A0ABN8KBH9_9HYPH|nr:hypothetical protein MES4922_550017 [Mesorhizobium ventifaucium]
MMPPEIDRRTRPSPFLRRGSSHCVELIEFSAGYRQVANFLATYIHDQANHAAGVPLRRKHSKFVLLPHKGALVFENSVDRKVFC